jgi:hypothetical protein
VKPKNAVRFDRTLGPLFYKFHYQTLTDRQLPVITLRPLIGRAQQADPTTTPARAAGPTS